VPVSISTFGLDFWVVDVNDILVFGLRRMSIDLGDLSSQGRRISATYALNDIYLV
jgi:hypothetical protein